MLNSYNKIHCDKEEFTLFSFDIQFSMNLGFIIIFTVNSVLSLLFLLGLGVCVYAGGYGGGANYLNYQQYYRPAYAQVQYYQPGYIQQAYVQPSYSGFGQGGSANLFAGSDTGSIIPIIIICT